MKRFNIKFVLLTACFLFLLPSALSAQEQIIESWVAIFNSHWDSIDQATAMAVDADGNVYVTGYSYGGSEKGYDYATIKYDTNDGNRLWVRRYNGPGDSDDYATAIVIDSNDNIYVTGYSDGGSVTRRDYATVKYDTNGTLQWVARYNGPANINDEAYAIAVDSYDNICVTGWSYGGSETRRDYATIKYNTDGNELWVARYNGPANSGDYATAIAVDAADNIYVTGYSYGGSEKGYDYATVKYDPDSTLKGVRRYNSSSNSDDSATAIAVDAEGNIYVTGYSSSGYATVKYDKSGEQKWEMWYNGYGAIPMFNIGPSMAIDAVGDVYITGGSSDGYATVKYNNDNGNELWVAQYNNPIAEATAITIDVEGNIYVTGYSYGEAIDYTTVKYDKSGEQKWEARFNNSFFDVPTAIAVDPEGNVYVTGWSGLDDYDYVTIKYSPDSDGDGIADNQDNCLDTYNPDQSNIDNDTNGDVCDACPTEDATGYDANEDGCIDTINGLTTMVETLVSNGVIAEELRNSLLSKVENAQNKLEELQTSLLLSIENVDDIQKSEVKENICAAINILEALKNQVEAQQGHKISEEAANDIFAYIQSVIAYFLSQLQTGETC